MTIKGMDGATENVASSATGNTALTLGAIGTGLGLLGGGMGLTGLFGGRYGNGIAGGAGNDIVTRHELDLVQQLQAKDIQLAQKDSQIALKDSESYTDQKMVEVYTALKVSENQLREEMRSNKDAQQAVNASQMAWNAAANANISVLQSQIQALNSVTKMVIPSSNVCDTGCCCNS